MTALSGAPESTRALFLALALVVGSAGCSKTGGPGGLARLNAGTRIAAIEGQVTVSGKPAAVGRKLATGDVLEVAAGGRAELQLSGGATATLEGADGAPARLEVRSEGSAVTGMVLRMPEGLGRFFLPKQKQGRLEVDGQHSVTAARGTRFLVQSRESGDRIAVREGSVDVTGTGQDKPVTVGEGEQLEVAADGKPGKTSPYDWMAPSERNGWGGKDVERQKGGQ
ncbi:MAG: FecR domain-containing protein [Candidatus Wallbacteria bacterium]|nr:FecR domain-containing protein [Candidatus Wallbacteria bacterium]